MDNQWMSPMDVAPSADEEERSYLYRAMPDDPAEDPIEDWRQAYWDYYFRTQEAGETPVAEAATVRYVLYCASCDLFSAHVVPLGQDIFAFECPTCLDVFSC